MKEGEVMQDRQNTFIDLLEAYALDGKGEIAYLREEVALAIEECRFLGQDDLVAALEEAARLLNRDQPFDGGEFLPVIFQIRDLTSHETIQSPRETATSAVPFASMDIPVDDSVLIGMEPDAHRLIRNALSRGLSLYRIDLEVASPQCTEELAAHLDAAVLVISSAVEVQRGVVHAIVAAETTPVVTRLLTDTLEENCGRLVGSVRPVAMQQALTQPSVSDRWYAAMPTVAIQPAFETVERINVILHELRARAGADEQPLWNALTAGIVASTTVRLAALLNEMEPLIIQHATDLKKRVRVRVSGDSERIYASHANILRRSVFELVVNAIHHGIEVPAERERLGKDVTGTIRILLRDEHGRLHIRVHDDGHGVDESALRTAFSHRGGGGLSWIRGTIQEKFSGKLSLKTGERGTTAELEIPYGPEVYRSVNVVRENRRYSVPATFVAGIIDLKEQDTVRDASGTPFVRYRGDLVPLLEPQGHIATDTPAKATAVIVQVGNSTTALVVDEVLSQTQVWKGASEGTVMAPEMKEELYTVLLHTLSSAPSSPVDSGLPRP